MYATTGTMFDQSVENYRNQEAIVEVKSGRRMTYGQWQERVHQMCNALQNTLPMQERRERIRFFIQGLMRQ